jgi:hypothetical protein
LDFAAFVEVHSYACVYLVVVGVRRTFDDVVVAVVAAAAVVVVVVVFLCHLVLPLVYTRVLGMVFLYNFQIHLKLNYY